MIQHDLSYQCFHRIPTARPARNSRLLLRKPGVTNGRPIHRAHEVTCARFLWEPQSQSERGHPSRNIPERYYPVLASACEKHIVLSEIWPPNHQWSTLAFLVDAKQKPGMLNWNVACIGARYIYIYMIYNIHNTHTDIYIYTYEHAWTRTHTHIYIYICICICMIIIHAHTHTYYIYTYT